MLTTAGEAFFTIGASDGSAAPATTVGMTLSAKAGSLTTEPATRRVARIPAAAKDADRVVDMKFPSYGVL
jgi:precorrin-2 methylase